MNRLAVYFSRLKALRGILEDMERGNAALTYNHKKGQNFEWEIDRNRRTLTKV